MSEPERRRGRTHDAEGAQEAILNAAEEVFAAQGFDGARIDAIAAAAQYNKSLIFHYFGDKLGLYTAVLRRIDQQGNELQDTLLAPLLADESLTSDASKFRTFLRTVIRLVFDFLVENPHIVRMMAWEGAEGWQTFGKIASQFGSDDVQLFRRLLSKAQEAGVIRPGRDAYMMFSLAYATCLSYLTFNPLLEIAFGEDLSSPEAMERAREMIVEFVVHGMMVDSSEAK